ncbi:hypothetical protein MVEN_00598400 [Mycena venus]|uniref:Uncharacterized protein n=1 Tax=Mycena venus TaxID=2733690 RepID=A0A8H6YP05_9AGAR|nr:hypothetical protein MVEN_00598400 [Mycena venus]
MALSIRREPQVFPAKRRLREETVRINGNVLGAKRYDGRMPWHRDSVLRVQATFPHRVHESSSSGVSDVVTSETARSEIRDLRLIVSLPEPYKASIFSPASLTPPSRSLRSSLPLPSYSHPPPSALRRTMRATVSIYEDPKPKSEADVWADEESKKTFYVVTAISLVAISTMGYVAYRLMFGTAKTDGLGSLISKLPRYPPIFSDDLGLRRH